MNSIILSAAMERKRQLEMSGSLHAVETRLEAGEKPVEGAQWSSLITYLTGEVVSDNGDRYIAIRYSKNKRPSENPELWSLVPDEPTYPIWSETTDGTIIYEDELYIHANALWKCLIQHTKSTVYTPKEGSSRWEFVRAG